MIYIPGGGGYPQRKKQKESSIARQRLNVNCINISGEKISQNEICDFCRHAFVSPAMVCRSRSVLSGLVSSASSSSRATSKEKKKEDKKNAEVLQVLIKAGPLHVDGVGEVERDENFGSRPAHQAMRLRRSREAQGLIALRVLGRCVDCRAWLLTAPK